MSSHQAAEPAARAWMILIFASTGSSTPASTLLRTAPLTRSRPKRFMCAFSGRVCAVKWYARSFATCGAQHTHFF